MRAGSKKTLLPMQSRIGKYRFYIMYLFHLRNKYLCVTARFRLIDIL
jgi:hypothetical protein